MSVYLDVRDDGLYLRADTYVLWLPAHRPYALLTDPDGQPWSELFLVSSVNTVGCLDDTYRLHTPRTEPTPTGHRITIDADGTTWKAKRTVLECDPTELRLTVSVEGSGDLGDVHLLGGYYSGDLAHGSGFHLSGADHRSVFNPEPWGSERRMRPATESTILDVLGSSVPGKEHWLFTPPPLCLGLSREAVPEARETIPDGPWLMLGIGAEPGANTFTAVNYDAVEGAFGLRVSYEGHTRVQGSFTAPTLSFRPELEDPYEGIAAHTRSLRSLGWLPHVDQGPRPGWWSEPIFCGWGSQCVLSSTTEGGPKEHATEANYDSFLGALAEHDLRPGIVVIDDRWQQTYGSWEADTDKWPDLRGWIGRRHEAGQRVLLWWKAWDPEGLPARLCVRNAAGEPLAVDPSNPDYEASLRQSVRHMLGPDGYDADGFKVDFSARTPSGPGLEHHGTDWGIELLHRLLWILYDEAKRTKADALVMTHTPHPYFTDVSDMIRLNDVNTRAPVVPQMVHRARVARAACPGLLIDTDNWPMPGPEEFRAYVRAQPDLGVPSLYYATHVDRQPPWTKGRGHVDWPAFAAARADDGAPIDAPSGEVVALTEADHRIIRDAWDRARRRSIDDG